MRFKLKNKPEPEKPKIKFKLKNKPEPEKPKVGNRAKIRFKIGNRAELEPLKIKFKVKNKPKVKPKVKNRMGLVDKPKPAIAKVPFKIKKIYIKDTPSKAPSTPTLLREDLENLFMQNWAMYKETIKRQILEEGRLDILANYVLEYEVAEHHDKMWRFSLRPETKNPRVLDLILGPRGSGKTVVCTYAMIIYWILKDPDEKILITSDTQLQAEAFLRVVKQHLESPLLVEIFGPQKGSKWDTKEITVLKRTVNANEATVSCIGAGGGLTSKHFTKIIADDLVDVENSRTQHQRDMMFIWFYKTLYNATEAEFSIHIRGTRYHWDDLYGRLLKGEFKDCEIVVPALTYHEELVTEENPEGAKSYWPAQRSVENLLKKRKAMGIHWYTQMQNTIDKEMGDVFDPSWILVETKKPQDMQIWQGNDLAVSTNDKAAFFVNITIGIVKIGKLKHYYIIDCVRAKLTAKRQNQIIIDRFHKFDPVRVGIEGNAFQAIKEQNIKDIDNDVRTKLIYTDKDKMTNAMKFQPIVEEGRLHVMESLEWVRDLLGIFPHTEALDVFDALYIAYRCSRAKKRKSTRKEPGIITGRS